MPMHAFLEMTGHGAGQQDKTKGHTPIVGFNHQAEPQSSSTFVVRKKIDFQSPELYEYLKDQKELPKWILRLWHIPRRGNELTYATMELKGAKIAWISWVMPDLQTPGNEQIHEYEDVAFTYTEMTMKAVDKEFNE